MLSNFSGHVASKMTACGAIHPEDRETYEYGIYVLSTSMLHIITVLFIGIAFRMVPESIVFYGSYALLRKFAGGYHAGTPVRCYLLSLIVVVGALFAVRYTGIFIFCLSAVYCCPLQPVLFLLCLLWKTGINR